MVVPSQESVGMLQAIFGCSEGIARAVIKQANSNDVSIVSELYCSLLESNQLGSLSLEPASHPSAA